MKYHTSILSNLVMSQVLLITTALVGYLLTSTQNNICFFSSANANSNVATSSSSIYNGIHPSSSTITSTSRHRKDLHSLHSSKSSNNHDNILISNGLINLGNTCYLNAQLQCAYHIPYVRTLIEEFSNQQDNTIMNNAPLHSLKNVFQQMSKNASSLSSSSSSSSSSSNSPIFHKATSTSPLCRTLGINPYEQQDTQEFWKLLLFELQYQPITNIYKGNYESYIIALDGSNHEKKTNEPFMDLSMDVTHHNNLSSSLSHFFTSAEVLSKKDGNGWKPDKKNRKDYVVDALKGCSIGIDGLPPVLQLHLMRFQFDWGEERMDKINSRFRFDKELDFSKILRSNTSNTDIINDDSQQKCKEHEDDLDYDDPNQVIYDLHSIIIHAGEYGSGHYYTYVRPNIRKNIWYRMNDDQVTQVSFQDVKADAFGGSSRKNNKGGSSRSRNQGFWNRIFGNRNDGYGFGGKSSSAYMLQYVKRSDIPLLFHEN